jgi:DNA-directed RNA polymerase specialized sigma24 family protein
VVRGSRVLRRSTTELEDETFEQFAAGAGIRLQRAFVAAYGPERGADAVAEALGYAWEHWRRIRRMDNPVGYLYRVGQSKTRPRKSPPRSGWEPASATLSSEPRVEPGLLAAVASLSEAQRVAVVLVHGYEWTLREVADLTGVTVSTVQTHVERALGKLRAALEVVDDA